jgi:exoribonuclease R
MKSTTRNIRVHDQVPLLEVAPDHAVVGFTLQLSAAKGSGLPALLQRAVEVLQSAAALGQVEVSGYRSWTEKLAGKGLFGSGIRSNAQASGCIVLALSEDDDLYARIAAVEALRARLEEVSLDEVAFEFGACEYSVRNREQHRAAVVEALQRHIEASAGSMRVVQVELDPTLTVDVQGPTRAHLGLSATAVLAR